ncbi:MAG: hypothetical protein SNJ52_04025, partial [Verrucomicrobiia bacterium]
AGAEAGLSVEAYGSYDRLGVSQREGLEFRSVLASAEAKASLKAVLPWLQHLNVLHWWPTSEHRHPVLLGEERWLNYLKILKETGVSCPLLIVFVKDDKVGQLRGDAATLQRWISELAQGFDPPSSRQH